MGIALPLKGRQRAPSTLTWTKFVFQCVLLAMTQLKTPAGREVTVGELSLLSRSGAVIREVVTEEPVGTQRENEKLGAVELAHCSLVLFARSFVSRLETSCWRRWKESSSSSGLRAGQAGGLFYHRFVQRPIQVTQRVGCTAGNPESRRPNGVILRVGIGEVRQSEHIHTIKCCA